MNLDVVVVMSLPHEKLDFWQSFYQPNLTNGVGHSAHLVCTMDIKPVTSEFADEHVNHYARSHIKFIYKNQ